MSKRRQNFQNISWFLDLHKRNLLDLDPPFQRRSVWNQTYREEFIDTILLDYPAPAIFLFGRIDDQGVTTYQVVDGKQRLTSIFDFVAGTFSVSEESQVGLLQGRRFAELPQDTRIAFFEYDFSVEYLPTNNEQVINNIFDRLNRNVVKLTPQELRHAKFNGQFITEAESLADWMEQRFAKPFPRIVESSRRQMKDVEVVATLLLFLEEGPKGYSVLALDAAFSERDKEWDQRTQVVEEFRSVIEKLAEIARCPDGDFLISSRFRNQADFYSLFAAVAELLRESAWPDFLPLVCNRLKAFLEIVEDDARRVAVRQAAEYYDAARSASNDAGPRRTRISTIKKVLKGEPLSDGAD